MVNEGVTVFERGIRAVVDQFDLSVPEERARAFLLVATLVSTVPDDASRLAWAGWASRLVGVDVFVMLEKVDCLISRRFRRP